MLYQLIGEFDPWSEWEDCSTPCGEGTRTRTRKCPGPNECIGNSTQSEPCLDNPKCTSKLLNHNLYPFRYT